MERIEKIERERERERRKWEERRVGRINRETAS